MDVQEKLKTLADASKYDASYARKTNRSGTVSRALRRRCGAITADSRSHAGRFEAGRRATQDAGLSMTSQPQLRFGLCCLFREEPIKFRTATATATARLSREDALVKLSQLCLANAESLLAALQFCDSHGISCFRIVSQILPLKTHPQQGYEIDELPEAVRIVELFKRCGDFAAAHRLRTCFHPDQFVVLNSRRPEVVAASIREIEYQCEVAEWVGADVVNIHGGGAWGDKQKALEDFERGFNQLSERARSRLTIENDDKLFTPVDLLPLCQKLQIPLVYDVHHHRCHPDGLSVEDATDSAIATWNREPMFHISSPLEGWSGPKPERHHDFINAADFPDCWRDRLLTVEVEAKAKEVAVMRLQQDIQRQLKNRE